MSELNSHSQERHQENSSCSSQLEIGESMDLRSKSILRSAQEVDKPCQLVLSTPSSSPLKTKVLSSPNGEMKLPVELDEDTTNVVNWEKPLSTTSSIPKKDCCSDNPGQCRSTWITTRIGKFFATVFYGSARAEGWMAITDDLRTDFIEGGGYKSNSALWFFDFWQTFELLLSKVGDIWHKLRGN
jgi:hypothetical protein